MQINLEREQDNLKKRHNEVLSNLQKEFESEKHTRKQKFDMHDLEVFKKIYFFFSLYQQINFFQSKIFVFFYSIFNLKTNEMFLFLS